MLNTDRYNPHKQKFLAVFNTIKCMKEPQSLNTTAIKRQKEIMGDCTDGTVIDPSFSLPFAL